MRINVNPDRDIAEAVQQGLKRNNGYCPCVLEKTPDTKCMCKDFRDKELSYRLYGGNTAGGRYNAACPLQKPVFHS